MAKTCKMFSDTRKGWLSVVAGMLLAMLIASVHGCGPAADEGPRRSVFDDDGILTPEGLIARSRVIALVEARDEGEHSGYLHFVKVLKGGASPEDMWFPAFFGFADDTELLLIHGAYQYRNVSPTYKGWLLYDGHEWIHVVPRDEGGWKFEGATQPWDQVWWSPIDDFVGIVEGRPFEQDIPN